jgi:hypothetical protein
MSGQRVETMGEVRVLANKKGNWEGARAGLAGREGTGAGGGS